MYLDFYRLKSAPFPSTPGPTWLGVSASQKAALDTLAAGIATRQGVVIITGAAGIGKTTLVHAYLARVAPPQLTTVVLWQARLSFRELLVLLARRFAVPAVPDDPGAMLTQLQQRFIHESQQGRQVVLIIDEAQDLPLETLEQLPALTHLVTSREPLLQMVLVGRPALLQHLRRRGLRRMAPRRGPRATIMPLAEAESLAYIRQRVARVALPGGPIFTPGALQAIVRHAHGVPRDVHRLCTTVLQAGHWVQQQPITVDLVQQVLAASTSAPPWPRRRLGLAAAASLVLVAGLLWFAPFSSGPQARRSSPTARAHSWMEALQPPRAPRLAAPRRQQPAPAPPAPAASIPGSAVGPDPGESHVRLGPREMLEPQRLESPSATLPPPVTPPPAAAPSAPATPVGTAFKPCDELKAEIQAKLDAKSLTGYALAIMARGDTQGHQIVGSCEGNTKKIVLSRPQKAP
jgi:general secretion pathway protein A